MGKCIKVAKYFAAKVAKNILYRYLSTYRYVAIILIMTPGKAKNKKNTYILKTLAESDRFLV